MLLPKSAEQIDADAFRARALSAQPAYPILEAQRNLQLLLASVFDMAASAQQHRELLFRARSLLCAHGRSRPKALSLPSATQARRPGELPHVRGARPAHWPSADARRVG